MGRLDQSRRASWKTWKPSGLQGIEEEVGRERVRGVLGPREGFPVLLVRKEAVLNRDGNVSMVTVNNRCRGCSCLFLYGNGLLFSDDT